MHITRSLSLAAVLALLVACGGESEKKSGEQEHAAPTTSAPSAAPTPTGKTITVELITDEKGNYFKPSKIEAHPGDVVRFTLNSGVHNVHFLPDSNPGKKGLPPASEFLQLPGQTWDFVVNLEPGKYYIQCDPHAALGMIAHLEVEGH